MSSVKNGAVLTPQVKVMAARGKRPERTFASTSSVDPDFRLDYWNHLLQPSFSLWPIDGEAIGFNASFECWKADRLVFSDIRFTPSSGRPYAFELGPLERDILTVRFFRKSDQRGLVGSEVLSFASGEVHVYPYDQAAKLVTSQVEHLSVYIPFELVNLQSSLSEHLVFGANSPVARVLSTCLDAAFEAMRGNISDDADLFFEAILSCARCLVDKSQHPFSKRESFERARSIALRSFIQKHLCDPDLTTEKVCSAFGASRATVYRVFEPHGGIRRFIRHLRLHNAMLDLSMSAGERGLISEIAIKYGFNEVSSFSRAFRNQFGASPNTYIGSVDNPNRNLSEFNSPQFEDLSAQIDRHIFSAGTSQVI